MWFDEARRAWRGADDTDPLPAQACKVVLMSLGEPRASARLIFERGNTDWSVAALRRMRPGSVVASGMPEGQAHLLKEALSQVGTTVEVQPGGGV
jgi:hypothetical protein